MVVSSGVLERQYLFNTLISLRLIIRIKRTGLQTLLPISPAPRQLNLTRAHLSIFHFPLIKASSRCSSITRIAICELTVNAARTKEQTAEEYCFLLLSSQLVSGPQRKTDQSAPVYLKVPDIVSLSHLPAQNDGMLSVANISH